MKGSTLAHQNLLKEFSKAFSYRYPELTLLPYTVGVFRDFDSAERIIHAGIKGVPDLIVFGNKFYIFLDAKTGGANFTKEQKAFRDRMKEVNKGKDVVFKLKSVEDGLALVGTFYEK